MNIRHPWIPYISILVIWIISSFFFDPWSEFHFLRFLVALFLGIICFLFIVYKIIIDNKQDVPLIFFKLARLPFLLIGSQILLLLSGRTFTEEGGWWILYAVITLSLPMSLFLYVTGLAVKKLRRQKLQQFSVKRGSLWIEGFHGWGKIFFVKFGD